MTTERIATELGADGFAGVREAVMQAGVNVLIARTCENKWDIYDFMWTPCGDPLG